MRLQIVKSTSNYPSIGVLDGQYVPYQEELGSEAGFYELILESGTGIVASSDPQAMIPLSDTVIRNWCQDPTQEIKVDLETFEVLFKKVKESKPFRRKKNALDLYNFLENKFLTFKSQENG
jgi:hypothetical protein